MPKETFFHLKEEKKENIEKALIAEFSSVTFEEASISNIIERAKIPRGSFYQYFLDKNDAAEYIIEKFIRMEHKKIYNFLLEAKGNIFETSLKIYDYAVEESLKEKNIKLMKNILQELRKNNINIFRNEYGIEYKEQIHEIIDRESLNIAKEEELIYIMKILTTVIRTITIEAISKKVSKEEGRKELEMELEILKKGMQK